MQFPRAAARQLLRRLGLQRIHHPSFTDLILREGIENVFDVGANEGHYGSELREQGYRGRILSFEPISAVYNVLAARAAKDGQWETHQLGLGAEAGLFEISVASAPVFSSFKAPSDYTVGKFSGAREQRRESVQVARLDTFLDAHPAHLMNSYLKIDTQGFEREVLVGAGDCLARFRAVQLELPLRALYRDQESWIEMIHWMTARGFEVAMAKENGFDWQAMRLLELDVVFVRRDARRHARSPSAAAPL